MNKPRGFTPRMRAWAKSRDGNQCSMYTLQNGVWIRCPNKVTESHHITPRGWLMHQGIPEEELERATNSPGNIIEICTWHHRGTNPRLPEEDVIHPDCRTALAEYRKGNHNAFHDLMSYRKELVERGEKYWNPRFDKMFKLIVMVRNQSYPHPFPYRK